MIKIFYDVETTGVDYRKHSIIQLSGLIEINGSTAEEFDFLVRPHPKAQIEAEALTVNKRTLDEVMAFPDQAKVFVAFKKKLSKYIDKYDKTNKAFLIGFKNSSFDDHFLRMWFELNGDNFFGSWFWSNTIDVSVLASQYLLQNRHNMPSFKLARVATTLGILIEENKLHEAGYDVSLTKQIYDLITFESLF